jgi:ABC-type nickel/cobalt efflux system permease component RcnA
MVRGPVWVLPALVLVCLCTGNASAHPLGNFSVNHLTTVRAERTSIDVSYTVDLAEIPTFQIVHKSPAPWDAAALQAWADSEAAVVDRDLHVSVDGATQTLTFVDAKARFRSGAGGLPTLYWTGDAVVGVRSGVRHHISIADGVDADRRIGWRDVVVAPATDPTYRLTAYPAASIGSPRHNAGATFDFISPGRIRGVAVTSSIAAPAGGATLVPAGYLSDLLARSSTVWSFTIVALIAFALGALHGLEPGHGKAVLAFTLVGARATVRQAAILALALTFAHTIAVVLLGVVLFFVTGFASEAIFGWIALLSGIAVAIIGARSLNAAIAHARSPHEHVHGFAGIAPLSFWNAIVAASSGGIAPCPAAIVVLLTALRLHRTGEGMVLVVIFSLGLAAVLSAVGIGVVRGASWLGRRAAFARFAPYSPIVTAAIVSLLGSALVAQGFVAQGIATSVPLIASLVLMAIAGFALVPRHDHRGEQAA